MHIISLKIIFLLFRRSHLHVWPAARWRLSAGAPRSEGVHRHAHRVGYFLHPLVIDCSKDQNLLNSLFNVEYIKQSTVLQYTLAADTGVP